MSVKENTAYHPKESYPYIGEAVGGPRDGDILRSCSPTFRVAIIPSLDDIMLSLERMDIREPAMYTTMYYYKDGRWYHESVKYECMEDEADDEA